MTWIYKTPKEDRKFDYSLNIRRSEYLFSDGEVELGSVNGFDFSIRVNGDCDEVESLLKKIIEACGEYRAKVEEWRLMNLGKN